MSAVKRPSLRTIAPLLEEFGIQRTYRAADGGRVSASVEAMLAVLNALGAEVAGDVDAAVARLRERAWFRTLPPVLVAWSGHLRDVRVQLSASAARTRIDYEVHLEQGATLQGSIPIAQRRRLTEAAFGRSRKIAMAAPLDLQLPLGYHELRVRTADADATALIIAAPMRGHAGDRPREWGVFAPLYALRRNRDKAIGDFADLELMMRWIAELHGDAVGTLPISAAFLRAPFDASPYAPASRLFWNELYLTTEGPAAAAVTACDLVDYSAVADAKRALLEPVANNFFTQHGNRARPFRDFLKLYPDAPRYARFRATGEHYGCGWPVWPARARAGTLNAADYDVAAAQYHLYCQFAAHTQLHELAGNARSAGVRLYLDMPLGVHPDSYDVWQHRDLFVTGVSAGAPPDPFFTKGQDWGFPPMNPVQLREQRYAYWRNVLQTQLRYAGILRLDHVMSLHRLYMVPRGFEATQGVYVRYPADELYGILTLESARHQAMIVGEDLGTVPAEVRKAMARHGVKRMFVVQFEASDDAARPINEMPATAVASLNTHDMPPFRAYWEGLDADLRAQLGLLDAAGVAAARAERARTARALSRALGAPARVIWPAGPPTWCCSTWRTCGWKRSRRTCRARTRSGPTGDVA